MSGILRGDFGKSITYDIPISELILSRLAVTIPLASFHLICGDLFYPFGNLCRPPSQSPRDYGVMIFSQVGLAIPAFWAGILLILFSRSTSNGFPLEDSSRGPKVPGEPLNLSSSRLFPLD